MAVEGLWLPIITPFKDNEIDLVSYKNLIEHYISKGITGIIPLATTGECPTISDYEFELMINKSIEFVNNRIPIYIGLGGNYTEKVIKKLKILNKTGIEGILSACPYYNLPSQEGIYQHFSALAQSTDLNIIIYNIPYRTGRNIENTTIYRLAELDRIVAIKDSCGNFKQSMELLHNRPDNLSILTGEDIFYYTNIVTGGDGGILASSHLNTEIFVDIYRLVKQEKDFMQALHSWRSIYNLIPLLFKEPNPAPLKYCLKKKDLIKSEEVRLPLTHISSGLQEELNSFL
ncbi:MAG: 4-hydroxy-tetrahydrodipicolinate synthase [Halanaerobiales bacterium]